MNQWNTEYITHQQTNCFSKIVLDYLQNENWLHSLYTNYADEKNILNAIKAKQNKDVDRNVLVYVLQEQYAKLSITENVKNNIQLLKNTNTFTICTAHQPNIFTGPLYYIYKILHTIKLCTYLKAQHPTYNFVPVYYMGSEDADIDEIGTFFINKQKLQWTPNEGGAVGRLATDSLKNILNEVEKYIDINTTNGKYLHTILSNAYTKNLSLANATLYLVNELFGKYGLIVLQPDNAVLKKQFIKIMQDELENQSSNKIVLKTNEYFIKNNITPQAHSREINLFYLIKNSRERIDFKDEKYFINNTNLSFSKSEIITELNTHPENFSPNVILRGLYQETILPNICFIGGGGELAYWLQLKNIFEHHQTPYPMLILRQSISIVSNKTHLQKTKLRISYSDIFLDLHQLQKKQINTLEGLDNFNVQQELHQSLFNSYEKIIAQLPFEMKKSVEANFTKSKNIQEAFQKKIIAQLKRKNSLEMQQIEKIKDTFFPNNHFQERYDNFIPYFLEYGNEFFDAILENTIPFGNKYLILQAN